MLNPDERSLLTSILTPPPGLELEAGLATTYSLDPLALLTLPVHLAWLAGGQNRQLLQDPILLLEAVQRVAGRLTVYADRGRIHPPAAAHALFALLEPMIVEVRAPGRGAFHAKLWVLLFSDGSAEGPRRIRLAVLSRNLTMDRSWDLALQLEGTPGKSFVATHRELGEFVRDLPDLATAAVPAERRVQAALLGDAIRRTRWELPEGWEELQFHVLGKRRGRWKPPTCGELAVVSPFLTEGAVKDLADSAGTCMALVSRPESLAALQPATRARFGHCYVLDEASETEDGEDSTRHDTLGLHAKALVQRIGWYTRLLLGSTNATDAAFDGRNVEIWADLTGKHSRVGRIEDLLSKDGFGGMLTDFDPSTPLATEDEATQAARLSVERARAALVDARLWVVCEPAGGDWRLVLRAAEAVDIAGTEVSAWPLSVRSEQAERIAARDLPRGITLATVATADVTGLVAFGLRSGEIAERFVLNLAIEGLPEERESAVLRRIVQNRDGFLRYLLLLLGRGAPEDESGMGGGQAGGGGSWARGFAGGTPLLEELVRVFSREPARLEEVRRVVQKLRASDGDDEVVPAEFLAVWEVVERAMEGRS